MKFKINSMICFALVLAHMPISILAIPGRCIAHMMQKSARNPLPCPCPCNSYKRDLRYRCMNCKHYVDPMPLSPSEIQ